MSRSEPGPNGLCRSAAILGYGVRRLVAAFGIWDARQYTKFSKRRRVAALHIQNVHSPGLRLPGRSVSIKGLSNNCHRPEGAPPGVRHAWEGTRTERRVNAPHF